ncbi:MAG TPA: oligogalacturonate lyase family protein [Gemmataceae bacterium]|nr:oligogalacturonate lyase family protein [Gemmataceae bacterium]
MKNTPGLPVLRGFLLALAFGGSTMAQEPPADWIEPSGHRVLRLTGAQGGSSFYFHQNSFTEAGDKLVVSMRGGLATIDLTTIGVKPCKIEPIVQGGAQGAVVGKKTRQVFYVQGRSLYATHLDTKTTREIVKLPPGYGGASGLAVNSDETLLASTGDDPKARELNKDKGADKEKPDPPAPAKKGKNFAPGGRSKVLFTVNINSGEVHRVRYATDWLNHTQFSPTDPNLILFCHEGTWDLVDRIWTIHADGTSLKKMHTRTMDREIFGHEFFSWDGKMIWYDLQTPRSTHFWLAGVNIGTGERVRYPLAREQWSVHYNQSADGNLFAGDGGGPASVANRTLDGSPLNGPGNGQWIWLFTPKSGKLQTLQVGGEEVKIGALEAEKLVDMKNHQYKMEPNVHFTPDSKWIVFRSKMHGSAHVYAVEVKKTN